MEHLSVLSQLSSATVEVNYFSQQVRRVETVSEINMLLEQSIELEQQIIELGQVANEVFDTEDVEYMIFQLLESHYETTASELERKEQAMYIG